MQNATQPARTPPTADPKQRSSRSSMFKTIKKSFSTIHLNSVFRKPAHVSASNLYGDTYSLDVAPPDVLERMLRDDLRMIGLCDRTPYNNGAIHDLRPSRSAFHLSSNYRLNASTIPTLFVATDPKATQRSHMNRCSSPRSLRLPIPNHFPQMAEVVKNPVALHPASLTPGSKAALPSPHTARLRQQMTSHSLRMNNTIKDLPERPLSISPTQQWFDQFHAHVDYVASGSAKSFESHRPPPPRSPRKDDSKMKKISYSSMSVALSTSITDLERRYEQHYRQKAHVGEPRRCAMYLETPTPQKSSIVAGVRYMAVAVANPC